MNIKEVTKISIKSHEGFRLEPYRCTENHLTGGYGHKLLVGEQVPKTKEGWEEVFEKDFNNAWSNTEQFCETHNLPDNEEMMSILCEMIFQLGFTGVSNFKMMIEALKIQNMEEAHLQMKDSKWHQQTTNRCESLAERMRNA
jgi:lysozyme|tara:strand:- start:395 stop:820 length:426 start_codon:yes stop_codon:yes gene_type:complete